MVFPDVAARNLQVPLLFPWELLELCPSRIPPREHLTPERWFVALKKLFGTHKGSTLCSTSYSKNLTETLGSHGSALAKGLAMKSVLPCSLLLKAAGQISLSHSVILLCFRGTELQQSWWHSQTTSWWAKPWLVAPIGHQMLPNAIPMPLVSRGRAGKDYVFHTRALSWHDKPFPHVPFPG